MYEFVGFVHRRGKSQKTGNDYDFFSCHFLAQLTPNDKQDGCECLSINVNPEIFYAADLAGNIGKMCEIRWDRFGRVSDIKVK